MANISLKKLFEAEDFKAKSKETGKLVHFKSKDSYQAALKAGTHEDPKAKKGDVPKAAGKPNSMFGGDYSKDRGVEAPTTKLTHDSKIVKALASKTGVNGRAAISWAEKNGVDLAKIASDVESKKLNPMDFMTAVVGNTGNKYAKDIISKYSQSAPKSDVSVDGQSDDELYDALYDMGYDFGELGSDEFDEEGFADAAMSLGYRYDDKNKVWNHRDTVSDEAPKADTPKVNLPKKASELDDTHAESLEKAINAEVGLNGFVDTDDYTDAIIYTASTGNQPTYTLYFGSNSDYGKPDEFRVTFASTAIDNDPSNIGNTIDKPFKSAKDAMKYMIAVAKKYKKELEMDDDTNESTKLTSMFKK